MEIKTLSPLMLTNAVALLKEGLFALKGETLKELLKDALIYETLYQQEEVFDEFHKKLLWWFDFYKEHKEEREETEKQLRAVALWLEKKVLCGGEPEIVKGKVVNYEEEKNLLNLIEVSPFELKEGEVVKKRVKLVGWAKRFLGRRLFAEKESLFEGVFNLDEAKVKDYERHAQKPPLFKLFEAGVEGLLDLVNRFGVKVLEADKEFFADRGYSKAVKLLERVEAEGNRIARVNRAAGILPYGAELFIYERVEKPKGRKEFHHLNEIMKELVKLGWASEIFKETRELTVASEPIGWISF